MDKVYTKFLLQWVTNVVVAVTVEMVYVAERSEQLELHDSEKSWSRWRVETLQLLAV